MYCIRCGNKLSKDEKFCTQCGNSVADQKELINKIQKGEVVSHTMKKETSSNKGLISLVLGMITFIIPIFPLSLVGLIFGILEPNKDAKKTIGIILNIITLIISTIYIVIIGFLIFAFSETSYDNDDYDYDYYDYYDMEDVTNQVIGNDYYGYLIVPWNWYQYTDSSEEGAIEYRYLNRYSATLNILKDVSTVEEAITQFQNRMADLRVTKEKVIIPYGEVTVLHVKNEYDYYIDYYIIQSEDGLFHSIQMKGPNYSSEYFQIPESFSFIIPEQFSLEESEL